MPKVKLEALQPGMVVTADVKNMDDMLLIPAGCELSEKHINILQSWGVTDVEVDSAGSGDASKDPLQQLAPEVLERLKEETKALFWSLNLNNAVEQEVYNLVLRRRVRQMSARA